MGLGAHNQFLTGSNNRMKSFPRKRTGDDESMLIPQPLKRSKHASGSKETSPHTDPSKRSQSLPLLKGAQSQNSEKTTKKGSFKNSDKGVLRSHQDQFGSYKEHVSHNKDVPHKQGASYSNINNIIQPNSNMSRPPRPPSNTTKSNSFTSNVNRPTSDKPSLIKSFKQEEDDAIDEYLFQNEDGEMCVWFVPPNSEDYLKCEAEQVLDVPKNTFIHGFTAGKGSKIMLVESWKFKIIGCSNIEVWVKTHKWRPILQPSSSYIKYLDERTSWKLSSDEITFSKLKCSLTLRIAMKAGEGKFHSVFASWIGRGDKKQYDSISYYTRRKVFMDEDGDED